jgi:hypothetical protein
MKKFFLSLLATSALTLGSSAQSVDWGTNPGSNAYEEVGGSAVDADGNVITVGIFMGTVDLDPGAGTFNVTSNGLYDIFIQKVDANGTFVWGGSIGDSNSDYADGVTTDATGNVYVVGNFKGIVDFDISPTTTNNMISGTSFGQDGYILKLGPDGSFIWSDLFGSSAADGAKEIRVDASGNMYVGGQFGSTCTFDPYGAAPVTRTAWSGTDLFVMKLNSAGDLTWIHTAASTGADKFTDMALHGDEVYFAGQFYTNLDTDGWDGPSTTYLPAAGGADLFVMHLDASGNAAQTIALGGSFDESPNGLEVSSSGLVYLAGGFAGTVDFDPGPGTTSLTSGGSKDAFLLCLSGTLGHMWVKYSACTGDDLLMDVVEDASGNLWTCGVFQGTIDVDFDMGPFTVYNNLLSNYDAYVLKTDASGAYLWSGHLAGTDDDYVKKIAYGPSVISLSGNFNDSLDIDLGAGTNWMVTHGNYDPFTLKLGLCPATTVGIIYSAPTLTADPGYAAYQWLNMGSPVAGATGSTFDPTSNGIYSVEVTDAGGCVYESDTVKICMAMTPAISFSDPTLSTDPGFASYQWLESGNPVAGATGSTFDPTVSGIYSVQVTDVYGCSYTSDTLMVVVTALEAAQLGGKLTLSPNPTSGHFSLACTATTAGTHTLRVLDLAGSLVSELQVSPVAGQLQIDLDLSAQTAGMYLIELSNGTSRTFGRIVKQ